MIDVPVLVKDALRDGRQKKNYRILVLNNDGTTDFVIDNDTLVRESVDIDERMCSGDTIKFGLCEGSSLEFQYFDHPNIYGRQLQVFVDVWSDYVRRVRDPYWHDLKTLTETDGTFTVVEPGTYKLDYVGPQSFEIQWTVSGTSYHEEIFPVSGDQTFNLGDLVAGDTVRIYTEYSAHTLSVELKGYYADDSQWFPIPLGFFTVEKCSRQASTGIKKVTAYNKLKSEYLDQKANDEIIELFGNNLVYIMDVNRALLGGYGVDVKEVADVIAYGGYLYAESDASSSFSPFRYTSLLGDQGAFSPAILKENASYTTSSNIYMSAEAELLMYSIPDEYADKYVQIDIDDLISKADKSISTFIKYQLGKLSANTSADVLWARLQNMVGKSDDSSHTGKYLKGYFFNVLVAYRDNTTEIYGDNVKNANGTFRDLRLKTLSNVKSVYVLLPISIRYGKDLNSDGHVRPIYQSQSGAKNEVNCTGPDKTYEYYDSNSNVLTNTYVTPKLPNGSDISFSVLHSCFKVKVILSGISEADLVQIDPSSIADVTLRELQSAAYETVCQFGKLDRETDLFSGVELNNSRLYPAEDLYPNNSLYPDGAAMSSEKSMYSKLWADEGNIQKWRNLIITYKGLDENQNEKDFTLQRVINADGTQDYNMSDNWLFRNLVWTAAQVGEYADAMVSKMRDITWFPFEMWCAGLPYLETGDEIEVSIGQTTYTSYVLQRQLKGIQNLQDTYINGTLDIF